MATFNKYFRLEENVFDHVTGATDARINGK